jgi:hypothetical protein
VIAADAVMGCSHPMEILTFGGIQHTHDRRALIVAHCACGTTRLIDPAHYIGEHSGNRSQHAVHAGDSAGGDHAESARVSAHFGRATGA